MFLDPIDNDASHITDVQSVGFDVGVLIREVNAGSTRYGGCVTLLPAHHRELWAAPHRLKGSERNGTSLRNVQIHREGLVPQAKSTTIGSRAASDSDDSASSRESTDH